MDENQNINSTEVCEKCGALLTAGQSFCTKCGTPIRQKNICSKCGAKLADNQSFCSMCGQKVVFSAGAGITEKADQFGAENREKKKHGKAVLVISIIAVLLACIVIAAIVFSLSGTNRKAEKCDELILAIGEVTLDDEAQIEEAEAAYEALSDKQKEEVENYSLLEEAREEYDVLAEEQARIDAIEALRQYVIDTAEDESSVEGCIERKLSFDDDSVTGSIFVEDDQLFCVVSHVVSLTEKIYSTYTTILYFAPEDQYGLVYESNVMGMDDEEIGNNLMGTIDPESFVFGGDIEVVKIEDVDGTTKDSTTDSYMESIQVGIDAELTAVDSLLQEIDLNLSDIGFASYVLGQNPDGFSGFDIGS